MSLTYTKPEHLSLRKSPDYDEAWLQDRIAEDTTILGLGDVDVIERERVQAKAGRLDLLLADPDNGRRYEVELMLGATDPSHIIRTIEYWDIERRRYPAYDHVAVIVAEDITSRFLNVLSLFSGSIPLIAIQLNALKVGDHIVLDFVRVLDQTELRVDDETTGDSAVVDEAYWKERKSPEMLGLAKTLVDIINEKATRLHRLNYTKYFIGLTDGIKSSNFVVFRPRKKHVRLGLRVSDAADWVTRLDDADLGASIVKSGRLQLNIRQGDVETNRELLRGLLHQAVTEYQE